MTLKVKVYDKIKYDTESKKVSETILKDVESFEIKTIKDEEIFKQGFDTVDENKEYLIVTFENGEISTFRNSYVDIFRM